MKRIIIILLMFPLFIYAEDGKCTSKDKIELNKLAGYVEFLTKYDKTNNEFKIVVNNFNDQLELEIDSDNVKFNESTKTITGLKEGQPIKININSKIESDCSKQLLRTTLVRVPYINKYYKHNLCKNHEHLTVCSSKYLNYEVTEDMFLRTLEKEIKDKEESEPVETTQEQKKYDYVPLLKVLIRITLACLGFLTSYFLFQHIYNKKVHKL